MAHATTTMTNPSRIARRFADLRRDGDMGLVAYITAGDPSLDATGAIRARPREFGR